MCVSIWGEKINESQLIVGNTLIIDLNIESKEFSNKWYTEIKAWKIDVVLQGNIKSNNLKDIEPLDLNEKSEDNLPF